MPDEPAENISGGASGGGRETAFDPADPETATRAEVVVDRLGERYWRKAYGGQGGFECLVRTILSQNTSDKASQPAHDDLMAQYGGGEDANSEGTGRADLARALADAGQPELDRNLSSAGLSTRNPSASSHWHSASARSTAAKLASMRWFGTATPRRCGRRCST